MTFGSIEVNTAMDWLAADQLFRAELQVINSEVQELKERKETTYIQADRDAIQEEIDKLNGVAGSTNADGKTVSEDGVRAKIIKNYVEYQNKRREALQ